MMKQFSVMVLASVFSFAASAQSETGTAAFNKTSESAVIYQLPYSETAISNGLEKRMSNWGKAKKVKSYLMYRNVRINDISSEPLTLYFNVDKGKNDNATLTMLIANDFDRFYKAEENAELFSKAKDFVNGFQEPVAAASLELQISSQDEAVKKADKKLKKMKDDVADYEKQKKKLEDKIADTSKEITGQEQELTKQKEQLDGLIKQRKN